MPILNEPIATAVTLIDIQDIKARNLAGWHPDERTGVVLPYLLQYLPIECRIFETVRRRRAFVSAAGEARHRLIDKRQRFRKARRVGRHVIGAHDAPTPIRRL